MYNLNTLMAAFKLIVNINLLIFSVEYDGYDDTRGEERGDASSAPPAPRYRVRPHFQPNYYQGGGGGSYSYNPRRPPRLPRLPRRSFPPPAHRSEEGNVSRVFNINSSLSFI